MSKKQPSELEETLALQLRAARVSPPKREFAFHPTRKWRFDFAWPDIKLAVECEGGIWTNGAHTRGAHFEGDAEKYNQALLLGWRVLRFTGRVIKSGQALQVIEAAISLGSDGWELRS